MSPRAARRSLPQLNQLLSDRDREVIHSIASHRFLTGKQLERFHFTDHASPETGARVCRSVLARLTREGILSRLERRVGGVRAGSASHVYCLGWTGRRLVGETTARRVSEPSRTFLEHTLAVAEAHLMLREAASHGEFELVEVQIEPVCWRAFTGANGAPARVRPDLHVISGRGELEYCWFLEIDLGSEHRPTVVGKCRTYEEYWRTGLEQQRSHTFPLVVWVTPDQDRASELDRAIRGARTLKQELFRVVSADQLVELFAGDLQ
jgi:hypothetical protein